MTIRLRLLCVNIRFYLQVRKIIVFFARVVNMT
jgi:hypothetical protein